MSEGKLTFTDLRAVHIVAYVKLDSGKVGIARHFPAAFGVVNHCEFAQSTRVIFEAEVVVVAPAYYKLLVGRRYVSAYLFRYSEVKRCVFNASDFACRDAVFVHRRKVFCKNLHFVREDVAGSVSAEVKV